jgi:tRNA A-37 threonylcarbamoyl transferase component Bud32
MYLEVQPNGMVGVVLGGAYQITGLLAEGGMGSVYEARHLRLNKRVAVKLLARDLAANREALARFHREAEVTSQLGHPHLVSVLDFGTTDEGKPYLVMERLEGEDLERRLLRDKCLPLGAVVAITKQVASALGAAHAAGIVHRDLKPANLFLVKVTDDEDDFVKVLDFGISKVKAGRTKLTQGTSVLGTPEYMSPEQAVVARLHRVGDADRSLPVRRGRRQRGLLSHHQCRSPSPVLAGAGAATDHRAGVATGPVQASRRQVPIDQGILEDVRVGGAGKVGRGDPRADLREHREHRTRSLRGVQIRRAPDHPGVRRVAGTRLKRVPPRVGRDGGCPRAQGIVECIDVRSAGAVVHRSR